MSTIEGLSRARPIASRFTLFCLLIAASHGPAGLAQQTAAEAEKAPKAADVPSEERTRLNLLGQTASGAGESRRNENVQFNPIDNNALRELNIRLGATATIISSFDPERNYFGAEFGGRPSSPVQAPPAAARAFHGNLFFRHDNSVLRARSFFQVGDVLPARENRYGFVLGGPLGERQSFTLDGEQQRVRGNVNGNVLVPKLDERTPLATDPAIRAMVERMLAAYPGIAPNRTDINARALNTNAPQRINTDAFSARTSRQVGESSRLNLSYRFTLQQVDAFQLIAGQNPDTAVRNHAARITWMYAFGPQTTLDLTLGYDRVGSLLTPEENAVGPSVSIGDVIGNLGPSSRIPIDRSQNEFRYAARVSRQTGDHSLKAGLEFVRRQFNGSQVSSHRGVFSFRNDFGRDALTNFRLGIPTRFSTGLGDPHRGFRDWRIQAFAGDDWQARSNLSFSYGVRYEPMTRPNEVNGLTELPYHCDCNNLSGHFGLAYRLPENWGVLRAGYGMHYAPPLPTTYEQARFNPPRIFKIEVPNPSLIDPLNGVTLADLDPNDRATRIELADDLVSPYSQQYNFSWELEPASGWRLQLGYLGSRSQKLLMVWYLNRARPVDGIALTTGTVNLRRPDETAFDIRRVLNPSRGYFDAGRATLIVPSWHGLSIDASYWFSKSMDLGTSYTDTASGEAALEGRSQREDDVLGDLRALSSFDQPHAFLWRAAYEIPGLSRGPRLFRSALKAWRLSSVVLVKTGTPFTVEVGSDSPGFGNVDGSSGDRPHLLDPSILGRSIGNPDDAPRLLPASAFAYLPIGDQAGNLGRNTFRKAGIGNVNVSASRRWTLSGATALSFRAESINFFNTPQFAEPGLTLTSPDFGQITNTLNDGRTFQFELRLEF